MFNGPAVSNPDFGGIQAAAARSPRLEALEAGQREPATRVLAEAFRDNPLNQAVIGRPADRRLRCNLHGSRASLEVAIGRSWCRAASEAGELCGVLLAQSPGSRPLPLPSIATQLRCLWGQGFAVARRWNRAHFELERLHPAEPHWYLDLLGVDAASRRRGVGGALLRDWLQRVDADGVPSYLETDRRENLGFYERAGFGILSEEEIVGVPVWRMWRHARRAAEKTVGGNDVR